MRLGRRRFLRRIVAAAAGVAAAPLVKLLPAPKPALVFHPDAIAMTIPMPARLDILYGYAPINPHFACKGMA